jgi:hypothetical protein
MVAGRMALPSDQRQSIALRKRPLGPAQQGWQAPPGVSSGPRRRQNLLDRKSSLAQLRPKAN